MTTPLVYDLSAPVDPPRKLRRVAVAALVLGATLVTAIKVADASDPEDCGCMPDPGVTVPASRPSI